MGKSTKVHKRIPKKLKSSSTATGTPTTTPQSHVKVAKKRAMLKEKDKAAHTSSSKGVLGDVDYVTLMMGGRRKAKEEAEKLAAHDV